MKKFELGKRHKLCGAVAVDRLFTDRESRSALCYPLRGVWREATVRREGDARFQFVVTVPKKRLRHAVDRVAARRRIREAYRLNHGGIEECRHDDGGAPVDMAFIYVANSVLPSTAIHAAMKRLLGKIHNIDNNSRSDKEA
ncbi:MAG: hypothetical protein HDS54_00575 [Barnesiella sp.]|nr:hypothetical protein [Barnesiella sp.]